MLVVRKCFVLLLSALAMICCCTAQAAPLGGKRVLLIDSYNDDYEWSADLTRAVRSIIEPTGASLHVARMDTKNHSEEEFKQAKALEMKALIEAYRPDVVIACDDNASKYVIAPYFKNSDLPIVFCGVNLDASKYGFPTRNITGVIEYNSFNELHDILRSAGGNPERFGVLSPDNESEGAEMEASARKLGVRFSHVRYVRTFAEWKAAFVEMQDLVDMLLIYNNAGIVGWNDAEAAALVASRTKILTATFALWMTPYAVIAYAREGAEQGRLAAQMAEQILRGATPAELPITHNREDTLWVNARLAPLSKFKLPPAFFDAAAKVIE